VNHNNTNFDLKQKSFYKSDNNTVNVTTPLVRERTTIPWIFENNKNNGEI